MQRPQVTNSHVQICAFLCFPKIWLISTLRPISVGFFKVTQVTQWFLSDHLKFKVSQIQELHFGLEAHSN